MATADLIEPHPIDDEFCSGLAGIEDLGGGVARLVLYTDKVVYEHGAESVRVVCKKIVMPLDAIQPGIEMTLRFLASKGKDAVASTLLKLVR